MYAHHALPQTSHPHTLTPNTLTPSHPHPSHPYPSHPHHSQIQQLLYLMQSGVVTDSIESLITAWPKEGETSILLSPPSRDMKRLSMWRKSAMMGGGKCNCGKCLKCNPSPSGVCVILAFVTGVFVCRCVCDHGICVSDCGVCVWCVLWYMCDSVCCVCVMCVVIYVW